MSGKFQKKNAGIPWVRILILCVLAALFAFALYQMCTYWTENARSKDSTEALVDLAVKKRNPSGVAAVDGSPSQGSAPADGETAAQGSQQGAGTAETVDPGAAALSDSIPILVDFELLQAENKDIVAWIYCEDTVINYPIVQGEDNQYYVRRLIDGSYNTAGTLFLDFRNSGDLSDCNSIIYGHNMTNDTMFGTLVEYKDQAYYEAHPTLWILTPERAYRIDLLAGLVTSSDDLSTYCFYGDTSELHAGLEKSIAASTFDAGVTDFSAIDQIVTLSTCTYEHPTARYVVIGSMTAAEYPEE